jgi:hypothetical protein
MFTTLDQQIRARNGNKGMQIYRSYSKPLPSSWAKGPGGADVGKRASAWSFKESISAMAAGTLNSKVDAFLDTIPTGHRVYAAFQHEPENPEKNINPTEWRDANAVFFNRVWTHGNANIVPAFNLMSFTFRTGTRDPWDWNLARVLTSGQLPGVLAALDGYGGAVGFPDKPEGTPSKVFKPGFDEMADWGFSRFAIWETGVEVNKAAWAQAIGSYLPTVTGMEVVCWWHSDGTGPNFFLQTDADIRAWAQVVAGNFDATLPPTPGDIDPTPDQGGGAGGGSGLQGGGGTISIVYSSPTRASGPYAYPPQEVWLDLEGTTEEAVANAPPLRDDDDTTLYSTGSVVTGPPDHREMPPLGFYYPVDDGTWETILGVDGGSVRDLPRIVDPDTLVGTLIYPDLLVLHLRLKFPAVGRFGLLGTSWSGWSVGEGFPEVPYEFDVTDTDWGWYAFPSSVANPTPNGYDEVSLWFYGTTVDMAEARMEWRYAPLSLDGAVERQRTFFARPFYEQA